MPTIALHCQLAWALGADLACSEPARILRPLSVGRAVGAGVSPACSFANASVTVGEDGDERVRRTEIADEVAWTVE